MRKLDNLSPAIDSRAKEMLDGAGGVLQFVRSATSKDVGMVSRFPIHEIRLGGVRACIWEEHRTLGSGVQESDFSVSIVRHDSGVRGGLASAQEPPRFGVEDLPLIAQVMDLAHLWIHEQAVGV